ncbi:hypothetical protein SEA_CHICKENKING_57 [Microbacterium phage ChickenKing]|nr:hypothetical protein SEA_CHICKENKING_57 [Microbacterium phage ChickenKing]
MNADRRAAGQVCIELLKECATWGEMSEASYEAISVALQTMQKAEYWSLRNQSKYAGQNESTDKQIAISAVALPALERAVEAHKAEDYDKVIDELTLAITTDGTKPKTKKKRVTGKR